MTFARVVPVVVASVLCGGCGVRAADGEESQAESVDSDDTSDETSEAGDDTGFTLEGIDEVCRATKTRKGCAAVRDELMQDYCILDDGSKRACGCQWVVNLSLPTNDGDCFFSDVASYCRAYATPVVASPGCLIGKPLGTCGVAFVGYQTSNEAGVHAVGTIAEAGCFSPDAETGTDYVSCFNETDSPTCECLMAEAEKICM